MDKYIGTEELTQIDVTSPKKILINQSWAVLSNLQWGVHMGRWGYRESITGLPRNGGFVPNS
jgi:hypothetical protein